MDAKELGNLYWFCLSVECGGYAPASLLATASAPTLSRAVSQLEEKVGEKLIHRHAKKFQLTNAGEEYYRRFAPIFKQVDEQWLNLSNTQATLTGEIYVSCPEPFADYFLQNLAIEFMTEHPGVKIHISFSSDTENYIDERIDLAIVTTPSNIPTLIQKPLFQTELVLAASPKYLKAQGIPNNIESLLEHNLLAGNTMPFWEFKYQGVTTKLPVMAKYSINSLRLMINAVKAGMGIGLIPKEVLLEFEKDAVLQRVLPDVECKKGKAYIVWSDRQLIASRVVAFREKIIQKMDKPSDLFKSIVS